MSKRTVCLILGVLLLSYIPLNEGAHESSDSFTEKLDESIQRIEISPDPNSISDLGAPRISNSSEILRSESADSPGERLRVFVLIVALLTAANTDSSGILPAP